LRNPRIDPRHGCVHNVKVLQSTASAGEKVETNLRSAPIKWLDSLAIDHPDIDADHREILAYFNDIFWPDGRAFGEHIQVSCRGLRECLGNHFRREENLLRDIQYPGLDTHAEHHRILYQRMDELFGQCAAACIEAKPEGCFSELYDLVMDHVVRHDLEFKSFVQESFPSSKQRF